MNRKLIFDIGMHTGRDTEFYLAKGFRVIAVEAAPEHVAAGKVKFAEQIQSGQLEIVDRAIFSESGQTVEFFINPAKDDWGSLFKDNAEKGMKNAISVHVHTITLDDLVEKYGIPYYLKCDIEGGDYLVLEQLQHQQSRPAYLSVEVTYATDFDRLINCGYQEAQLINQTLHPFTPIPNPPREGSYVQARFDGHSSGLFGLELNPEKWISIQEAKSRYSQWIDLHLKDPNLAFGWIDVHVRAPGADSAETA